VQERGHEQRDHHHRHHDDDAADTIAALTPTALAIAPARRSPSRGPPATTTRNTPCIRPRMSSGAAVCSIEDRSTALTMSPAPATARNSTASHRVGASPNPMIATPQTTMAASTTAPCRSTRDTHPDVSPMSRAPIETPANSQPSAFGDPAYRPSVSSGNTACGQANSIATTSTTNVMSSTGWVRRKAKPSPTPRSAAPRRSGPVTPAGGSGGRPRSSRTATRKPERVDGVGEEQVAQADEHAGQQRARR
jgi:hypothetical protein